MATGVEQHPVQERAGCGLTLGELLGGGLGIAQPARQPVADALQLAEIEQPRRGSAAGMARAGGLGGAPPFE